MSDFGDLEVIIDPVIKSFCNFDFELYLIESKNGLKLKVDYNTDLFDQNSIQRWLEYFQVLLKEIVSNPKQNISSIPILPEKEQQQMLIEQNDTGVDFPHACIHEIVASKVAQAPNAVAIEFEDKRLTFRELDQRANQLAHHLKSVRATQETLIGLYMDRSPQMVIGLLGILKTGAAYVPLDPSYSAQRIQFMLNDAQVQLILTQQQLVDDLNDYSDQIICIDSGWDVIARNSSKPIGEKYDPENLAYVIYTSGSTGRPKGVQIPHRAVVIFLCSMKKKPGLSEHDTLLAVTSLSFDIAVLEIFLPLITGAKLILATQEETIDGSKLIEKINTSNATVMQATPATWRMLVELDWQGMKTLKVLCGGEALPLGLAEQLLPKCASLWNMYGPTETTVWSAISKVEPNEEVIAWSIIHKFIF